jgi:hypothetical protein
MTPGYGNFGQGTWPPGGPPVGPPPRRKRPRWLFPIVGFGTAVVLVVVFLVVAAVVGAHESAQDSAAPARTRAQQIQLPVTPDALFAKLTRDIQDKNETAFLSLVAPAARQAVQSWWANQMALGFTTGAILPATVDDQVTLDGSGDATVTVLAGTHNSFDPVGADGLPDVPSEEYRVGLHFASQTATGQITSWEPLDDAPWDAGLRLYVRKAAHVVVAGDPDDSALVNQTLPLAEAAAEYDIKLLDNINPQDLHQSGFVVFVSSRAATRNAWFRSGPQPTGWSGDAYGGLTFPLPGADAEYSSITNNISSDPVGGARVIIVPYQQAGETPHTETAVLVHEFIHDILYPDVNGFYNGSNPVPAWANEGIAVAVQDLYLQDADPVPGTYHFGVLTNAVEGLPSTYRDGRLPSTQQIYDESQTVGYDWYQVAGSVYEYIAIKYGMNQMFAAAVLLTTNDNTPFGNVLASSKNGTLVFYSASSIESGWRTWLAGL